MYIIYQYFKTNTQIKRVRINENKKVDNTRKIFTNNTSNKLLYHAFITEIELKIHGK